MKSISINIPYWKSNDMRRENNIKLCWNYLKKFKAYCDKSTLCNFDLSITLFDFSYQKQFKDAIHFPYNDFVFEKSKKLNDLLLYHSNKIPDFISVIDSDIIIPQPYDNMIIYLNELKQENFYVFNLADAQKESPGIDYENNVICFDRIQTIIRNMEPDLGGLFFVDYLSLIKIGGFDERFTVWGGEDNYAAKQLKETGLNKIIAPYNMIHLYHEIIADVKSDSYTKQVDILFKGKS